MASLSRDRSFRSGLMLVLGVAVLLSALVVYAVLLEAGPWIVTLGGAGAILILLGVLGLRSELAELTEKRRGELALFTAGALGILAAIAYASTRLDYRFDLTAAKLHSLSEQSITMLERLDKPVHIVYFHDARVRATVELYQLFADHSDQVTLELHDPTINPARARMLGVQFAGTSVMRSEDRTLMVHGDMETDIANGILRVSLGAKQLVCFLDGHGEADPFSRESHDHMEGEVGHDHSHGLGAQYVLHERHGMAKARHSLETLNYEVHKLSLLTDSGALSECSVLVVAGPKTALLAAEVDAIRAYLAAGGNGYFLLDPFTTSGLEPVLREYGIVMDDTIVIDEASHYWTDISAPAVTSYNNHQVTRGLPLTFYPGARSLSPTAERVPGTAVSPLVNSSKKSYGETTPDRASYDPEVDLAGPRTLMVVAVRRPVRPGDAATIELGPAEPERDSSATIRPEPANALEVTGRSRIAVVGDSDFATNSFFHFLGNGDLFLNTMSYLAGQEDLIGIEPRTYDLPRLSVTNRQIKGTFVLSVLVLPFVLAVAGTVVWWRQR